MRCFIAVVPPEPIRRALWRWAGAISDEWPTLRVTALDNIHLTLRFLDDIDEDAAHQTAETLETCLAGTGAFQARLNGFGVFPVRGEARLIWSGVTDDGNGGLERCWKGADDAATTAGVVPDNKPFVAHITVGRFRVAAPPEAWHAYKKSLGTGPSDGFTVSAVSLWHSELRPSGPRYSKLRDIKL